MPYKMDTGERKNPLFCSYCQNEAGEFTFTGTRQEFQKMCYEAMKAKGMGTLKAKFFTWTIRFAPHWK